MKIKYLVILFLCFLLTNCSKRNDIRTDLNISSKPSSIQADNNFKPIEIDLLNDIRTDFYSFIDSIQLIKLEPSNEAVIGNISNLFLINDILFVCDIYTSKTIFAFDMHGKFLYKINKLGSGPGEYKSISMVKISDTRIIILDRLTWKIIQYDLRGNLLSEKRVNPCPADFIMLNNNTMILLYNRYGDKTPFKLVFTDMNFKNKDTAFPFRNKRVLGRGSLTSLQKTGINTCLYCPELCDTIFQITDKKITPKYNLNLFKKNEIESFFTKYKDEMDDTKFNNLLLESNIAIVSSYFELDDFLFVDWVRNRVGYKTLISKKDTVCKNFVTGDLRKRKFAVPCLINGSYQNSLLASIEDISKLDKMDQESFYSHLSSSLDIERIKELEDSENNPVVCIFHLKKIR